MFLYNDNNFNVNEDGLNFNFALSSISDQEERSVNISSQETNYQKNIFNFTENHLGISDESNLNNNPQFKVKKPIPVFMSENDIQNILKEKIQADKKTINIFNSNYNQSNEHIEKTMKETGGLSVLLNQKTVKINNKGKKQLGRKTKRDKSNRNHNKIKKKSSKSSKAIKTIRFRY